MTFVACHTAIYTLSVVLEYERSAFILMTACTKSFAICSELMFLCASVRIVTIRAIHDTFFEAMVGWLIEISACSAMAGYTELRLVAFQHGALAKRCHLCFLFGRWMNIMTARTADTSTEVLA